MVPTGLLPEDSTRLGSPQNEMLGMGAKPSPDKALTTPSKPLQKKTRGAWTAIQSASDLHKPQ
jgi:hypothetical protein